MSSNASRTSSKSRHRSSSHSRSASESFSRKRSKSSPDIENRARQKSRTLRKKKHESSRSQATRIEVGRLTMAVTREHVLEIFSTYGRIKSLEMSVDQRPSYVPGAKTFQIASVQFESSSDAARAKKYSHGGMIDLQEITVDHLRSKTSKRRKS